MAGAIFETYALVEIVKSWWHRLKQPPIYFYRDRDRREIDLLLVQDGTIYPVEFKRGASAKRSWVQAFSALDRFNEKRGPGAVISLVSGDIPLSPLDTATSIANL